MRAWVSASCRAPCCGGAAQAQVGKKQIYTYIHLPAFLLCSREDGRTDGRTAAFRGTGRAGQERRAEERRGKEGRGEEGRGGERAAPSTVSADPGLSPPPGADPGGLVGGGAGSGAERRGGAAARDIRGEPGGCPESAARRERVGEGIRAGSTEPAREGAERCGDGAAADHRLPAGRRRRSLQGLRGGDEQRQRRVAEEKG